jgi:hypothetical protein
LGSSPAAELGPTDAPPGAGPPPNPAPAFTDNITANVNQVPIDIRQNAQDWVNNVQARFGPEGGHTEVKGLPVSTTIDGGVIVGAKASWTITEQVPTVRVTPGSTIAPSELTAVQTLADRIRQHEDGHAGRETTGRTGFAASLKGRLDSAVDGLLAALECRIGAQQRVFDNLEGQISLDANNNIQVSGVDHPEYVTGCP